MFSAKQLDVIRRTTEAVVTEIAPAERRYFFLTWQRFLQDHYVSAGDERSLLQPGLFFGEQGKLKLVTPLAIAVTAYVYRELEQQFGKPEFETVRRMVIAAATSGGMPDKEVQRLATSIAEKLIAEMRLATSGNDLQPQGFTPDCPNARRASIPACVVYYTEGKKGRLRRCAGTHEKLEPQFVMQQKAYSLRVNSLKRGVWITSQEKMVHLQPRELKMLVLLLLHRNRPVPLRKAAEWILPYSSPSIESGTQGVRDNLKGAVAKLRKVLKGVEEFEIPKVEVGKDYYCEGSITFCILLSGRMDAELEDSGLYPVTQFD